MLVRFLTGHINVHYTLSKMRRAKNPSYRRCGVEKETLVLEKIRMQTLGFVRMDLDQIKEVRRSRIAAFGKGAGLLNSPL